ncbi:MAG: methionine adenosyltransferase [Actinomycetaceae bacterium]|nr:methionine adenosyltransferase [Actinomycetaceae bacterium]
MSRIQVFTSESVTEGHPDKICDRISDTILDAMLAEDPHSRVAVETMATTGLVHVAGEVTTQAYVEIPSLVRDVITNIGYTSSDVGFDGHSCGVTVSIGQQSPDIAECVDISLEHRQRSAEDKNDLQGAGDQGLMFGYACNETPTFMPMPIFLAHRLSERLTLQRKNKTLDFLRPDGKTQVTVVYENDIPIGLDTVVISTQHDKNVSLEEISHSVKEHIIHPVLNEYASHLDTEQLRYLINPSGKFIIGGPMGDAGLTGRKIIVDTYGGMARHGGGAFSGKDPSKVDRSGAYAARYVAKNIVAAQLADRCEVQIAYAIGKAQPVSIRIDTFGSEKVSLSSLEKSVASTFDLRPAAIIEELDLLRPIYSQTSAYGHFGRENSDFTWEQTNKVETLLSHL